MANCFSMKLYWSLTLTRELYKYHLPIVKLKVLQPASASSFGGSSLVVKINISEELIQSLLIWDWENWFLALPHCQAISINVLIGICLLFLNLLSQIYYIFLCLNLKELSNNLFLLIDEETPYLTLGSQEGSGRSFFYSIELHHIRRGLWTLTRHLYNQCVFLWKLEFPQLLSQEKFFDIFIQDLLYLALDNFFVIIVEINVPILTLPHCE